MAIKPITGTTAHNIPKRHMHPAVKGAIVGAGVSTVNTAISWIKCPEEMKQTAKSFGSNKQYALALAGSITLISLTGAIFNTILNKIIEKTAPKNPPKAVN